MNVDTNSIHFRMANRENEERSGGKQMENEIANQGEILLYSDGNNNEYVSVVFAEEKYSLQGTTQGRYLTGGVPPVRFSM